MMLLRRYGYLTVENTTDEKRTVTVTGDDGRELRRQTVAPHAKEDLIFLPIESGMKWQADGLGVNFRMNG